MNNQAQGTHEELRALQLLSEATGEGPVSQRELAQRLGIALGLVNSYIKNFVARGYIRVKNYPRNRYGYLLTPQGMTEKARLACQHINYFTSLYTVNREQYRGLFRELSRAGEDEVCFCGVDEVAEIAWLSLQEVGLALYAVMDDPAGGMFMGREVAGVAPDLVTVRRKVVITSLKRSAELRRKLLAAGIPAGQILQPGDGLPDGGDDIP